jgi:hypothetical protein
MRFQHGLTAAYYRDVVRPRIVFTEPVKTRDPACEIHVLTSEVDWLNLLWALKSFYVHSGRSYALCIHDDGTLHDEARQALRAAFPDARLILRAEADARVQPSLAKFPLCQQLRATNVLALKVFDFHAFLEAERMMIFDSDILFFSQPTALLKILETSDRNSLNRDWRFGYTVNPKTVSATLGFELPPLINSGLGLIHRASLRLDWIEEFLTLPGVLSHHHQVEQTLIALCSARYGFEMLPEPYDVRIGPSSEDLPCRHYTGPIRHLMYAEGIKRLISVGFLEKSFGHDE